MMVQFFNKNLSCYLSLLRINILCKKGNITVLIKYAEMQKLN